MDENMNNGLGIEVADVSESGVMNEDTEITFGSGPSKGFIVAAIGTVAALVAGGAILITKHKKKTKKKKSDDNEEFDDYEDGDIKPNLKVVDDSKETE